MEVEENIMLVIFILFEVKYATVLTRAHYLKIGSAHGRAGEIETAQLLMYTQTMLYLQGIETLQKDFTVGRNQSNGKYLTP